MCFMSIFQTRRMIKIRIVAAMEMAWKMVRCKENKCSKKSQSIRPAEPPTMHSKFNFEIEVQCQTIKYARRQGKTIQLWTINKESLPSVHNIYRAHYRRKHHVCVSNS